MLLNAFKSVVPYRAKLRLREWVLTQYRIPFSRFGVPGPLVARFREHGPLVLIDVGASQGHFAEELDQFAGIRHGLLIEPIPARCEEIKKRFLDRPFEVVCAAVGEDECSMEMEILNWDYSSSLLPVDRSDANVTRTLDLSVREKIRTRVSPLDALCEEFQFNDLIDLLKVDVQGAEHMVLAGARKTLQRTKAVWMEVSFRPLYHGAARFEAVYDLCRTAGFALANIDEGFRGHDGELLQADALFIRPESS